MCGLGIICALTSIVVPCVWSIELKFLFFLILEMAVTMTMLLLRHVLCTLSTHWTRLQLSLYWSGSSSIRLVFKLSKLLCSWGVYVYWLNLVRHEFGLIEKDVFHLHSAYILLIFLYVFKMLLPDNGKWQYLLPCFYDIQAWRWKIVFFY